MNKPSVFEFEKLQFQFGPSWHPVGWDKDKAYIKGIQQLKYDGQGTKAVDCLAVHEKFGICFIEVTDGRGYNQFANTLASHAVFAEVGFKVRDSLAGLVGAVHKDGGNEEKWMPFRKPLESGKFSVVLWVENDAPAQSQEAELAIWTDQLRRYVGWLTHRNVIVTNLRLGGDQLLPDVTVTNLKGAGQPPR